MPGPDQASVEEEVQMVALVEPEFSLLEVLSLRGEEAQGADEGTEYEAAAVFEALALFYS
jgi:hypothetical protein